jgi:hypothetical protein
MTINSLSMQNHMTKGLSKIHTTKCGFSTRVAAPIKSLSNVIKYLYECHYVEHGLHGFIYLFMFFTV